MNLTLSLINLKLHPFSLVAYGEDHTPTLFGIQTPSKNAFITDLFSCWYQPWIPEMPFLSWSRTAQTADLPKSVQELTKILEMAGNFKKYLAISPIIWTTFENEPQKGNSVHGFSGTAFFQTGLVPGITTKPDHKLLFLMPRTGETWKLNGHQIEVFTSVRMASNNAIRVSVEGLKGITKYNFSHSR